MKIEELENLQKKISSANEQRSRAIGALDKIKEDLKHNFGVDTIEQAQEKLAEMKKDLKADEERLEKMLDKISSMTDWDKI
jgi:DNA repair exonuclease SbcCD ATPase subunit